MVCDKSQKLSAKKLKNAKKIMKNTEETMKVSRIQQEIQTDLSPKFTEMKTGAKISRFGRPQMETKQDASLIPTDIVKFIPKHSPKRLKPKDIDPEVNEPKCDDQGDSGEMIKEFTVLPLSENISKESSQVEDKSLEHEVKMEVNQEEKALDMSSEESSDKTFTNEILPDSGKDTFEANHDDDSEASLSEKGKHDFSDTDSALGSTFSAPDSKDQSFFTGQILWGSFATHSWYPCIVYPFDEDGNIIKTTEKSKQIHVKYFNWKGCKAFLSVKNVFEFNDIDDFWAQIHARNIKKSKVKTFPMSCYKAIEEAKFFKQYPVSERLKIFDEILMYQLSHTKSRNSINGNGESPSSRSAERKSVDSAHESSSSPTPSSPQYEHSSTSKSDPIELYLEVMSRYESNKNNKSETARPKRTRKSSVSKPEVEEAAKNSVEKEDSNRRRSSRPVKKRIFEDFEHDTKSEADYVKTEHPETQSETEPKSKRAKVSKDETLEDRFLIQTEYLRNFHRTNHKKKVCMDCLVIDESPTFRCSGNGTVKCSGWFHQKCSGHCETKREEIRHQCGDSDEIIQTQAMKTILTCKSCYDSQKNCFVCTKPVELEDNEETRQCPNQECRLTFHSSCLKMWPQSKISKGNKRANQCPQHLCHTCFSKDIHITGQLLKCMKCPAAYHTQLSCIPAGTQMLSQTQIICPRHPTEKELTRNAKEKNAKPLNIDWCIICSESGNLVCCESCPNAFHTDCINNEDTDDNYYCQECQEGRLPLYYTIVWARVGAYRWWPGLILTNNVIPESVFKSRKYEREFCVRFFGSYDYFWFTCERVFPYNGLNMSVKGKNSRLDSAFNIALHEARQFSAILAKNDPQSDKAKPKPYTKIVQNRPVPPVKLKKIDEHTQDVCSCKPTDPNPCGKDSDCINMHLNCECDKLSCPAGEACQNQKLRNRENIELKIVHTSDRGFGAVTVKDVPEGTFVIEYVGELIDTSEFNRRMNEKIKNKEKEFYFLTIEADLYVDAEPAGNLARFINHSCEPNCKSRKIIVDGNTRIGIFTNQPIKAGTELTFDYQMVFVDNKKTACFCGSRNCSGLIGEKPKEDKKVVIEKTGGGKKKLKRKSRRMSLPRSKKRRTVEETIDPLNSLMEKLPNKLVASNKPNEAQETSCPTASSTVEAAAVPIKIENTEEHPEEETGQENDNLSGAKLTNPEEPSSDPFMMLLADTIECLAENVE